MADYQSDYDIALSPDSLLLSSDGTTPKRGTHDKATGGGGAHGSSAAPRIQMAMPCVVHEASVQTVRDEDHDAMIDLTANGVSEESTPQYISSEDDFIARPALRGRAIQPHGRESQPPLKGSAQRVSSVRRKLKKTKARAFSAAPTMKQPIADMPQHENGLIQLCLIRKLQQSMVPVENIRGRLT